MGESLPEPKGYPWGNFGHLPYWGGRPLELLEEGARLGPVFGLRLGSRAVVGHSPQWNKMLLTDLPRFRSKGSFSAITPYLNGGIITTDAPDHKPQKAELNRSFHAGAVKGLRERIATALEAVRPSGEFEANLWASEVAQVSLNAAYFGGLFPRRKLAEFLAPLKKSFPAPILPRPFLFRRTRALIEQIKPQTSGLSGHLETGETMIGLAAGYDTTAHTLAWALWHAANHPQWHNPEGSPLLVKETLRLYPPGFMGSRRAAEPFSFGGLEFPKNSLVLYSPYLTHRNPEIWARPLEFDPARFTSRLPAWGYLPFGGGERICLGMHFANMVLEIALGLFERLTPLRGDPSPRPGLTLAPRGELWLRVGGGR
ncbi:MAG: cytochrome P450 [Meiothermus sp.]|nr:cytochrome P450 [Meiothermus sp.]